MKGPFYVKRRGKYVPTEVCQGCNFMAMVNVTDEHGRMLEYLCGKNQCPFIYLSQSESKEEELTK